MSHHHIHHVVHTTKKGRTSDRGEGARREGAIISANRDGTLTSDSESLLSNGNGNGNGDGGHMVHHGTTSVNNGNMLTSSSSSSSTSTDELVGRICQVRGHDEAVLCTGKPVFICFCFPWTFEYMLLRDGTSVRVLQLESAPGEQTVYRVQVLRSSTHVDDGMLGTIRGCWLVPDNGGNKNVDSSSLSSIAIANGDKSVRRPMTAAPFLAAISRGAVAAVATPSDGSPEADLRERISQILTTKGGISSNGNGNNENTMALASSHQTTSSVSLSMMSSSTNTNHNSKSIDHHNHHNHHHHNHHNRVRPGLPSDGSTRVSPAKFDSKRPADDRAVHPGGVLPSIASNASSFDMDHSYKTPPGSPSSSSSSRVLAPSVTIPTIPLLPPPSTDGSVTPISSSSSTPMSSTSSTSSSGSRQVDHPLHARYTASTPTIAAPATVTPSGANTMRSTHDEEKYPLANGTSLSPTAPVTPLSPTSAILAAIADSSPTSSSSSSSSSAARIGSHHRVASSSSSSDMPSMTLSTVDIASSSSSGPSNVLSPTTAAMVSRVGANGASFANFRLPEGDIQASDIDAIVQLVESGARDITYPLIFARLAGTKRLLSGDVLRPFLHELLNKANVQATQAAAAREAGAVGDVPREAMDVLWKLCAQIIDIRTGVDFLEINFNFGAGVRETTIKVPGSYTWVLDAKFKEDPLAVHALNKPKYHCSDSRQLVIRNQVRFKMNANGIESVRDGDLGVKQVFKFNAGLRTEHKANTIEYDSLDRPFIEVRDGKPLIVDGHYVPRRLNDWLVVTVLKKDVYIGLPDLAAI